jgi:hypothetical protein
VRDSLAYGHGLYEPRSIFTEGLERRIAESYEASPWVERVVRVRRVYPDRFRVELELRRPAVLVASDEGLVPVDREGVRLAALDSEAPELRALWLPTLLGVASKPPPLGVRWRDRALDEGLALVEHMRKDYLEGISRSVRFESLDVSNVGGRADPLESEVSFITPERVVLEWGRSPASPLPDALGFEEKLRQLRNVLVEFPGLAGVQRVKLHISPPHTFSR